MNVFLFGFANSGKTTIFNLISKKHHNPSPVFTQEMEPCFGSALVFDERVKILKEIFPSKEEKYTQVNIVDYLGLQNDSKYNKMIFNISLKCDILIFLIRNFKDENIISPISEVNPLKEFKVLFQEVQLYDLQIIETRLRSIQELEKKGKKGDLKEKEFLEKFKKYIEGEESNLNLKEEKKKFPHLSFLSWLPFFVLINSDENGKERDKDLIDYLKEENIPHSIVFGKIEEEAEELGDEGKDWLLSYGIKKPFKELFLKELFKSLGYISFITVGDKEIKTWIIEDGTNAYEAAGKIHSDIQKGFIKAEVIPFEEFLKFKDFHKAREAGVLKFEGKDYKIKDGDIIYFRFHI